jgi:arylsulfatase A-like enzyme
MVPRKPTVSIAGRNHHQVGNGVIAEVSTRFPGYNAIIPDTAVTIGEILKDNGYNTAWFGKNHNTPDYETSQTGPFVQWPAGMGFEYFFGFNGGDTNQWAPALIENTRPVQPPVNDPKYHLMTDMTDRSIAWIRNQNARGGCREAPAARERTGKTDHSRVRPT